MMIFSRVFLSLVKQASILVKRLMPSMLLVFAMVNAIAQPRIETDFNAGWKFMLGDDSLASRQQYNDSKWRSLQLPHDWSIESDFSSSFPATNQGGALPGGIGWYRKTFTLPKSFRQKLTRIAFDGVYQNSEVWINGHSLGKRPNGYTNFHYDLTPYLLYGKPNTIAVKVDNSEQPNSRWYSGSGIYRDVTLISTNKTAFEPYGIFITTPMVSQQQATLNIAYRIKNEDGANQSVVIKTAIYDASGNKVASLSSLPISGIENFVAPYTHTIDIQNPHLWSIEKPTLYRAVSSIEQNGKTIDQSTTTFGIRSIRFDGTKGFFLNNASVKIQGVCMHHDLGALGAVFNKAAAKRQLVILKQMGCNAIRVSHNPPAAAFLDLCDEMGFLVMDESFDMWQKRKNKFDYHLHFKEWHKQDLEAMVLRDRNHPSVIIWSIGNEIREQFDSTGITITKNLVDIVKALDTTRPVTCALTENVPEKNFIYQSQALDVLGFNYKLNDYPTFPERFKGYAFIATETASALASRGSYDQESETHKLWPPDGKTKFVEGNADKSVSAYDHVYAYWGSTHEATLLAMKQHPFMAGMFVWSGFDFLGEPVPYAWPARSSYYGIVDLAGFPKDVFYLYQSEWSKDTVLHIFPHWNWKAGDTVDVWSYFNHADEVELMLNGRSLGTKRKIGESLHITWKVPYEAGTLQAVSKQNGKTILTKEIKTAGSPAKIELIADKSKIKANGKDMVFITARLVDGKGNPVPDSDILLEFSIKGAGFIAGTDNGFQADTTSLKNNQRKTWKGLALAMVQSNGRKGNITIEVKSHGIPASSIRLKSL